MNARNGTKLLFYRPRWKVLVVESERAYALISCQNFFQKFNNQIHTTWLMHPVEWLTVAPWFLWCRLLPLHPSISMSSMKKQSLLFIKGTMEWTLPQSSEIWPLFHEINATLMCLFNVVKEGHRSPKDSDIWLWSAFAKSWLNMKSLSIGSHNKALQTRDSSGYSSSVHYHIHQGIMDLTRWR